MDQNHEAPIEIKTPTPVLPTGMELFHLAWDICKTRYLTLVGIMLVPSLFYLLLVTLFVGTSFLGGGLIALLPKLNFVSLILLGLSVLFLAVVCQTWAQIALLLAIRERKMEIGIVASFKKALPIIFSYWWVYLLMVSAIIGGFIFFVIPGVIFSLWFSLAIFVLIGEEVTGVDALLRSKEYMKGNIYAVLWRILFLSFLYILSAILFEMVFQIIGIPSDKDLINFLLAVFVTPIGMTYMYVLYEKIREMKHDTLIPSTEKEKHIIVSASIFGTLMVVTALLVAFLYRDILLDMSKKFETRGAPVIPTSQNIDASAVSSGYTREGALSAIYASFVNKK